MTMTMLLSLFVLLVNCAILRADDGHDRSQIKRRWNRANDQWANYQRKRRSGFFEGINWSTSERLEPGGCTETDGYKVCNNVWGDNAGTQTIWMNSHSLWGVIAEHPASSHVASYPYSEKMVNMQLSQLSQLSSTFSVTVPEGDDPYAATYDIWDQGDQNEVMLWLVTNGGAKPIAEQYTAEGQPVPAIDSPQDIGGHTWMVYRGSNGKNAVFSFVRTSNAYSGQVDAKAILDWIAAQGWFGDIVVGKFQFGFEITSAKGGNFVCNEYSVFFN